RVQVVRQHADCYCLERLALLYQGVDSAEAIDVSHQQVARPVDKRDGEEECSTFDFGASVVWHCERTLRSYTWARRLRRLCPPYSYSLATRKRGRDGS